jgi:dihydroorotase
VRGYNTNAKMSPPLRHREDVEGLIRGIGDGTIEAVASDHAPHELDSKQCEFGRAAMGILGLQTNVALLLRLVEQKLISRKRMVELFTVGPNSIFKLGLGSLRAGAAADVVVIDPQKRWNFDRESNFSKSTNTPFWGEEFSGGIADVFVGGRAMIRDYVRVGVQATTQERL